MKKTLLSSAIAILIALLLSGGAAQNTGQEVVGTVSCAACVAKGARKIDLACARACLTPKKSSDVTKSTSADAVKSTSADLTKNTNADLTSSTSPTPPKNTSTDLVIITDGDYKTIPVDNPDKVKSHLAHRVVVTGYWVKNGFHVVSVRTL